MIKQTLSALALGLCALAPAAGWAQDAAGIRLVCGGIGSDESAAMRAEVGKHALTILFTTAGGGYLSEVDTRIDDPLNDRRAESVCGPVGQVDVSEPGRYRIVASYRGHTETHWVDLKPMGGARTVLRWAE